MSKKVYTKKVDELLDDVAGRWADHYECCHAVREGMHLFPEVDWIDAMKRAIKRNKKVRPDSDRMESLFRTLAPEILLEEAS